MDPALAKIDAYLEDEKLYRMIKKDLSTEVAEDAGNGQAFDAGGSDLEDAGGEAFVPLQL